jgi:hypothetical protein
MFGIQPYIIRDRAPVCFTAMGPGGDDKYATVRLTGNDVRGTIKKIEQTWQTFTTKQPLQPWRHF